MSIFQKHPFLGDQATDAEQPAPAEPKPEPERAPEVPFDTFASVELRVGTVRSAEPVEGSEKLLRLRVDFGEGEPRQILSGIAKKFAPVELIDRQFAFVTNLPPRAMMGLESHGMILAADAAAGGLALVRPTVELPPGSRLH